MLVSLILATYGRTEDLCRLMDSLAAQSDRNFELIVADQNLDERVTPFVNAALAAGICVTHLRLDKPSLSGARNSGLHHARGDVVAFPDDDCWYEPQTIAKVRQALEANQEWDGVVAQWVEQAAARRCEPATALLCAADWRRFRGGDASSISLFLKIGLVREMGGFDSRLGVGQWFGAGEETDLILSALSRGAQISRWPPARVHHRFDMGTAVAVGQWRSALRRSRGTGALYAKHGLSFWVRLRGIAGPIFSALWPSPRLARLAIGLAMSWGRLQGMVQWSVQARSKP